MTWSNFYLLCFVVGFLLSILSLLMGMFHFHLPGGHGAHFGGAAHGHVGHVPGTGHGHHLHVHYGPADAGGTQISPVNTFTLMAFLAWFGGVGYLLTGHQIWSALVLLFALGAGLLGSSLVFLYLTKVLLRYDGTLVDSDFRMEGVLGRVSVPIREGGTGEIIFSQGGVRKTCGARSESGKAIPKGAEIVITKYDKGIAYVQLWEEMVDEAGIEGNPSAAKAAGERDAERH